MFMFFRFKLRVLEVSQTEQAKVLQSLVMNMRNGGHPRNTEMDMAIVEEAMKNRQMQMQMQMQQKGGSNHPNQHSRANDLIDVSDEEDDEEDDDDDDTSSEFESGSESESSSDSGDDDDNQETNDNTTKKIIFNNGGALESQMVEHLTGDDIKVIELTEPLYHVGGGGSKHDNNSVSDDDNDGDGDDNDDMSDDDNDTNDEETSDDTELKGEEHSSLPSQQQEQQHLETSLTDTTEIKTIFKADKQQHADYNSMNVPALRQLLKTKLTAEGMQYNETAINKLNKKELIKHLTQ
jgi:hypothetical protein